MKTIRIFAAMFVLTVMASKAMASGSLRVDILPLTAERAVVAISNSDESNIEISIYDASGVEVYNKTMRDVTAYYRQVYDFSRLENGDYKLVVTIGGERSEREFNFNGNTINVGEMNSKIDPFFSFNDKVFRVAYLNYPGERMELKLYDGNDLIFTKALENTFSVNEGLNLSNLKSGNYQAILAVGDDAFDYTVEVK